MPHFFDTIFAPGADYNKKKPVVDGGSPVNPVEAAKDRLPNEMHPMLSELGRIDKDFVKYLYETSDNENSPQFRARVEQAVQQYIETMKKYSNVDPESLAKELLRDVNQLSNKVDPVFAYILRAVMGNKIMTSEMYWKIRRSWCTWDIPPGLDRILNLENDGQFVQEFQKFPVTERIKLEALQRMNILGKLCEERNASKSSN